MRVPSELGVELRNHDAVTDVLPVAHRRRLGVSTWIGDVEASASAVTPSISSPVGRVAVKVVALLTCHNRRNLTLRCLGAYFSQRFRGAAPALEAIVVDDGSTDGTGEAVQAEFRSARVIAGDGTLYWARGMQLAESQAVPERPEFLLWLNDDVMLDATAVDRLLTASTNCSDAIVVGALLDPDTNEITYSGVVRSWWHPLRTRLVEPGDCPQEADMFNGNVVLVPRRVYERVGAIDGGFSHGQADFDYGLRAKRAGFRVVVAPGSFGTCPRGEPARNVLRQRRSLSGGGGS